MFRNVTVRRILFLVAIISLAAPLPAYAQKAPKNPRWAVSFSVTPSWHIAPFIENAIADDDESINFRGSELTIGFGRGSRRGGDWGVNFVRKPFKDGLISESFDTSCFSPSPGQNLCNNGHETKIANGLMLTGFEQARSVVSAIAGDWEAARRVELVLPETGVCSRNAAPAAEVAGACCGSGSSNAALSAGSR